MVMGHKNDASLENCHILAQATGFFMCCSKGSNVPRRPQDLAASGIPSRQYLRREVSGELGIYPAVGGISFGRGLSSGGHLARVLASRNAQRVHAAPHW